MKILQSEDVVLVRLLQYQTYAYNAQTQRAEKACLKADVYTLSCGRAGVLEVRSMIIQPRGVGHLIHVLGGGATLVFWLRHDE